MDEAAFAAQQVDGVHAPAVLDAEDLPDAQVSSELDLDPTPIVGVQPRSLRVQEVRGERLAIDRPRIGEERLDELPRGNVLSEGVLHTARDRLGAEAACAERENVSHEALVSGVERRPR